ncbi:MAG: tetratricopeptide repeat protein, partial [Anaerolineales bacterium]|nr:tetratricopeptide repeat protein [Anaerolineales bacterium]MDW8447651.1 tetratricopeptide repeat protein [Anaerolineales bacterium]
ELCVTDEYLEQLASKPQLEEKEEQLVRDLIAYYLTQMGKNDETDSGTVREAQLYSRLGLCYAGLGQDKPAEEFFIRAVALYSRVLEAPERLRAQARIHYHLGGLFAAQRRLAEAETEYTRALNLQERLVKEQPEVLNNIINYRDTARELCLMYLRQGRIAEIVSVVKRIQDVLTYLADKGINASYIRELQRIVNEFRRWLGSPFHPYYQQDPST